MKTLFATILILSSIAFARPGENVVVVPDLLVKFSGGAFKGDIVAAKKIDEGSLIKFEGLRFETKHETFYFDVDGEIPLERIVCRYAAPKGWHAYGLTMKTPPKKDSAAVFFFRNGYMGVSDVSFLSSLFLKDEVLCSSQKLKDLEN